MIKFLCSVIIALSMCACTHGEVLTHNGKQVRYYGRFSNKKVWLPANVIVPAKEFRAVWVATVLNLDFPKHVTISSFKRDAAKLMRDIKNANFNTVIFQVRSNCDAWYPSKYNAYSKFYTGYEGVGLKDFDPLAYLISQARLNNLEFHAWFNPYRVLADTSLSKKAMLSKLSQYNFAKKNPDAVLSVEHGDGKRTFFLDPGNPKVVNHINTTVDEVVRRYRPDGIHFDDYFYLYRDIGNADIASFKRFNPNKLNIHDWRRNNVTTLIRKVQFTVRRQLSYLNKPIAFGVSPFGIWRNKSNSPLGSYTAGKESYSLLYADVRLWIKKGYIDYVIPQLYWQFNHPECAYAGLTSWWCQQVKGTKVKLYTGLSPYRIGSTSDWTENELFNQLRFNRTRPEISGFAMFSARHILKPQNKKMALGVRKVVQHLGQTPNVRP